MTTLLDPLDLVRDYYQALNRSDLEAIVSAYHEDCAVEGALASPANDSAIGTIEGRTAVRHVFVAFFEAFDAGFADETRFKLRTIAPIESGWVHVEWVERERRRGTNNSVDFVGYSHFLIEDGRIRRHRTVRHTADPVTSDARPVSGTPSRSYPPRPVVGVGAVIIVDGQVVLIKRRYEPLAGQWSLPGGALEVGERLEAGVAREILEETGLEVEVGDVIEVFDRILLDEQKKVRYHFVLIDYLCRPIGGELTAGSDVADAVLVDPSGLEPYRLTPKATAIIAKAFEMANATSVR